MKIPRFLSKHIPGFQIIDVKEFLKKGLIEVHFKKDQDNRGCWSFNSGPYAKIKANP